MTVYHLLSIICWKVTTHILGRIHYCSVLFSHFNFTTYGVCGDYVFPAFKLYDGHLKNKGDGEQEI